MSKPHLLARQNLCLMMPEAIARGAVDVVAHKLESCRVPSPRLLSKFLHMALKAPSAAELADFSAHGYAATPVQPAQHEANILQIVNLLAQHGADFTQPDETGRLPAQTAFELLANGQLHRQPACEAVLAHTNKHNPGWQPAPATPSAPKPLDARHDAVRSAAIDAILKAKGLGSAGPGC